MRTQQSWSRLGKRLLDELRKTHRRGVQDRFVERFSDEELDALDRLLRRLTELD